MKMSMKVFVVRLDTGETVKVTADNYLEDGSLVTFLTDELDKAGSFPLAHVLSIVQEQQGQPTIRESVLHSAGVQ